MYARQTAYSQAMICPAGMKGYATAGMMAAKPPKNCGLGLARFDRDTARSKPSYGVAISPNMPRGLEDVRPDMCRQGWCGLVVPAPGVDAGTEL